MLTITRSTSDVAMSSPDPSAGTISTGSVYAMSTRRAASMSRLIPHMTVHVRQIRRKPVPVRTAHPTLRCAGRRERRSIDAIRVAGGAAVGAPVVPRHLPYGRRELHAQGGLLGDRGRPAGPQNLYGVRRCPIQDAVPANAQPGDPDGRVIEVSPARRNLPVNRLRSRRRTRDPFLDLPPSCRYDGGSARSIAAMGRGGVVDNNGRIDINECVTVARGGELWIPAAVARPADRYGHRWSGSMRPPDGAPTATLAGVGVGTQTRRSHT
jgi:hypothetical protein